MIHHLDHLVLTATDEARTVHFYGDVLGMSLETFIGGTPPVERKAFRFGNQKINLHLRGREFEPKAHLPVPCLPGGRSLRLDDARRAVRCGDQFSRVEWL